MYNNISKIFKGTWKLNQKVEINLALKGKNRKGNVFSIFDFYREVCLKLIQKVFRYPLSGAQYRRNGAQYPHNGASLHVDFFIFHAPRR